MTEQRHAVSMIDLDRAIQTVIHDLRVPKRLRTALAVYQKRRGDQDNRKVGTRRPERTEHASKPRARAIQYSLAIVSDRCNPRNATFEDSCIMNWPIAVEREISIKLWHNDGSLDWSVEINSQRHEHVASDVVEALVECAVIFAEMSLERASDECHNC
jgi:hypothetical protein